MAQQCRSSVQIWCNSDLRVQHRSYTSKMPLTLPVADKALAVIYSQLQHYLISTPKNNFDREIWDNLKIISASIDDSGKSAIVHFSIVIPENFGNHNRIVAGGAVATLFDGVTGQPLVNERLIGSC